MHYLKRELVVNYETVDNKQGCGPLLGKTCGVSFPKLEQLGIGKGRLIEDVELDVVVSFELMGDDPDEVEALLTIICLLV